MAVRNQVFTKRIGPAEIAGQRSKGIRRIRTQRRNADKQQSRKGDEAAPTGDRVQNAAEQTGDEQQKQLEKHSLSLGSGLA